MAVLLNSYKPFTKGNTSMRDTVITVGETAPDFELPASLGQSPLKLSSLRGQKVVLAFYVLDFTGT